MAWLGEGLSTLRGQITSVANFTKEVLSEGKEDESDVSELGAAQRNIRELEEICAAKDLEISKLRRRTDQLEAHHAGSGVSLRASGGPDRGKEVSEHHEQLEFLSTESWHQHELQAVTSGGGASTRGGDDALQVPKNFVLVPEEKEVSLMGRMDHLEAENRLLRKTCSEYEEQVAELLDQRTRYGSSTSEEESAPDPPLPPAAEAATLREQLQASECRVLDLEVELRRVRRDLITSGSELACIGERLQVADERGSADDRPRAPGTEHDHRAVDVLALVEGIGDEQLHQRIRAFISAMEVENQTLKSRCAELEATSATSRGIDSDIGYKVDHFTGSQVECTSAADTPHVLHEASREGAALQAQVEDLSAAKQCLTMELESMASLVQDLESRNISLQEENATLSTGLEELDQQNQIVIDQLLETKKAVQTENKNLKQEASDLRLRLQEATISAAASKPTMHAEVNTETSQLVDESRKQFDNEMYANIMQLVTFELPKEYYDRNKDEVDSSGLVKALVKVCEESKWKKDTLERKIAEYMKEVRDAENVVKERDAAIVRLEKEVDLLRGHVKALVEQVTSEQSDGDGLAVIPEHSEEAELLEQRAALLEAQLQVAAADREKFLAELTQLRNDNVATANELSAQQSLVIDAQNKYTQALNDLTVLETENRSLVERITSSAVASSKGDDLEVEYLRLQDLSKDYQEQLREGDRRRQELELETAALKGRLQEADAELSQTRVNLLATQEAVERCQQAEADVHQWESKCQEMISAQNALRKEIMGLENSALVMSRKLEESVEAKMVAESKCSSLEETLRSQESAILDDRKYKEQLNTVTQAHKDMEDQCSELNAKLLNSDREIESSRKIIVTLEEQLQDLVASKSAADSECQRLLLERSEAERSAMAAGAHDKDAMLHEVHKWKTMATGAERQLDEALTAKEELEAECRRLFSIETKVHNQEHLEREVAHLTEVSRTTEARLREAQEARDVLKGSLDHLKACLEDQKNLEQEANEWREKNKTAELQLQDALGTNEKLQTEVTKLRDFESECLKSRGIVEVLQHQLNGLLSTNNELRSQLEVSETQLQRFHHLDQEILEWKEKVRVTESQLREALMRTPEVEREYKRIEDSDKSSGAEKKDEEKPLGVASDMKVGRDVQSSPGNIEMQLENMKQDRQRMLATLDEKIQEVNSLKLENSRLLETASEKKSFSSATDEENRDTVTQFQSAEASAMAKETIANLAKIIKDKDLEIQALAQKCGTLTDYVQETSLGKSSGEITEQESLLKDVQRLGSERDELIRTVQVKHRESLQYHGEIQRLSGLLNQEMAKAEQVRLQYNGLIEQCEDKQKALVNSQNELIAVKQRLDRLERASRKHETSLESAKQAAGQPDDHESNKSRDEVIAMKTELAKELGLELKTREKEVELLRLEIAELKSVPEDGAARGKRSLLEELQAERVQLLNNLSQETTRNKYLQNEVQEQHEKENALLRELARLREHLVAIEDSYTQETVQMEQTVQELQAKLAQAEDRMKSCSTAYTSANIRANQHVESLQGQARLIGQQRDDMQAKLSAAEDLVQKHAAALRNLQAVLEQFQRDKETDIAAVTGKLQKHLQGVEGRNSELCAEVASLQGQLAEAKEGLGAATRLAEQLDKKAEIIAGLKEEVHRLNEQLTSSESREKSASLSSEGKVDRYLVKNLLIGYLVAPAHTKPQALRIVSTVLDFNHDERCRVGLEPGSQPTSSWFKSLMHPGNPASSNQSLAEAFVRFLESESRPQPQLRLLPSIQDAPHRETKSTDSPAQDTRSPLLLTEVQLPTFTQFPVARSSSSILKDVLKDS